MSFSAVPFPAPTSSTGGKGSSAFSPAVVAIISVLGSAFLVVSYYRIFAKVCTRWQNRRAAEHDVESQLNGNDTDANTSPLPARGLDELLIKKIPIFDYKRGDGFTVETECPVCLMEFVDKQELRMLPKCAHAFHVQCIDTWLASHSTCPLCRANIFTDQVMSQFRYPPALSPPQMHHNRMYQFFGTPPHGSFSPNSSPADYSMGDFARFSNGNGRSPAPTLRGLLDFEDHQQNQQPTPMMWVPDGSESGRAEDPGEESLRLYNSRDYGGDSSSRHHGLVIPTSGSFGGSLPSVPPSTDPPQAPGPPQQGDVVSRTTSFKEGLDRSRSRDNDHKWHMHPARRSSSRRNPFASVRSFSMGTSRRLANALEFLDLEGLRSGGSSSSHQIIKGGDKIFSPYEYGITETPDYHDHHHDSPAHIPVASANFPSPAGGAAADRDANDPRGKGGSSSETKENLRSPSSLRYTNNNSNGDTVNSSGTAVKGSPSGRVKGRSLSFTSPFSLKRSLSSGRNVFSLRYSGRSSRIYSSTSPPSSTGPGPSHT